MLTKRGIELDLEESKYKLTYNGLTFYFSSLFYLKKFKNEIQFFVDNETKKLYNKFKVHSDYTLLLSIALYKKIEKRGFRILVQDKEPVELYRMSVKF